MTIQEIESPFVHTEDCNKLRSLSTPVIEKVGDGICIHFLYFGDNETKSVHVVGSFPGWELDKGKMMKITGNNVWVKSFKTDRPVASTYYFSVNDDYGDHWGKRFEHFETDPFNSSKLSFSEAPDDADVRDTEVSFFTAEVPMSSLNIKTKNPMIRKEFFTSDLLGNTRNLWIYDPITATDKPKNLLIVFDGFQYTEAIPVANMIDLLHSEGKINPTVMVGVDSPDRFHELCGNDGFADFIAEELLPWIQGNFNVSHNPADIALCGASLGGLAAFYTAFHHPDRFGNVLSQSGSFNHLKADDDHDQYWSVDYLDEQPKVPVRVYMNAGILEDHGLQEANDHTYQTLIQKGYDAKYESFNGGHDVLWWRETFLEGLEYLFGKL